MRRKQQQQFRRLILLSIGIFFLVCLPVWVIRGCRANRQEQETNQQTYRSPSLQVYDTRKEQAVEMDLEEYLVGVVAAEMPASYELEALKAQAVAARTYTAKRLLSLGGKGCSEHHTDICTDSTHCQAYRSQAQRAENWGENASLYEQKIRKAVEDTAGQIVLYGQEPIEAFFHSTAGGMTEASENAFSAALPYLRPVESNETEAPRYEGSVTVSRRQFASSVNDLIPEAGLRSSTLEKNVKVSSRFESGRVDTVCVGDGTITGKQLRSLFDLDSTNITFEFTAQNVIMHTKGYGHGVGMSQTGANQLASQGRSYSDILLYYYTDTALGMLNGDSSF